MLSAWVPMMSGLSTTMYAIVKKVTIPPRTSRPTVEPRSEMWKKPSSPPRRGGDDVAVVDMAPTVAVPCDGRVTARGYADDVDAGTGRPEGDEGGTTPYGAPPAPALEPLALPMRRIVEVGLGLWALALVVTLVVPVLHTGARAWWPWCCAAGLALGAVGWVYLRRGRGNAASA